MRTYVDFIVIFRCEWVSIDFFVVGMVMIGKGISGVLNARVGHLVYVDAALQRRLGCCVETLLDSMSVSNRMDEPGGHSKHYSYTL